MVMVMPGALLALYTAIVLATTSLHVFGLLLRHAQSVVVEYGSQICQNSLYWILPQMGLICTCEHPTQLT